MTAPAFRSRTTEADDLEMELLLEAVARRWGYDFRNYSRPSLRRRLRRAMTEEEVTTISALQERVLHDEDAMRRFVVTLSVHVTSMFRDPPFYRAFRKHVVPLLRTYPFTRIWHAGCSSGEEVYSMAILLEEEGLYERCRLYATDLSDVLVERARRGILPLAAMRDYTLAYQRSGGTREFSEYYTAQERDVILNASLRRNIVFAQHNLASDSSFNEFHVILCRNVMIYFDRDLRDRVQRLFYDSLLRLGVLGLGIKETIVGTPHAQRYEVIDESMRLYRKMR